MTTAEQLRAEGEAKMLLRVLTGKFGPLPDSYVELVERGEDEDRERWTDRALAADSLDEVFR